MRTRSERLPRISADKEQVKQWHTDHRPVHLKLTSRADSTVQRLRYQSDQDAAAPTIWFDFEQRDEKSNFYL